MSKSEQKQFGFASASRGSDSSLLKIKEMSALALTQINNLDKMLLTGAYIAIWEYKFI